MQEGNHEFSVNYNFENLINFLSFWIAYNNNWQMQQSDKNHRINSPSELIPNSIFNHQVEGPFQIQNPYQKNLENLAKSIQRPAFESSDSESREKGDHDEWKHSEIKKIFTLYLEFGSQWKLIQTQFSGRSSNSIKNRFYTVVRTFLKVLFREHPEIKKKLPHEIPSKTILKFYEGREDFIKFKGFGKRILKTVDYNLESKELKIIAHNHLEDILVLFHIIFTPKVETKTIKSDPKTKGKKIVEKQIKSEQKEVKSQQGPSMKAMQKTDAFYDSAGNVPEPTHPNMEETGIKMQPGPMGFIFVPSTNFFSVMGFNPFFSYY